MRSQMTSEIIDAMGVFLNCMTKSLLYSLFGRTLVSDSVVRAHCMICKGLHMCRLELLSSVLGSIFNSALYVRPFWIALDLALSRRKSNVMLAVVLHSHSELNKYREKFKCVHLKFMVSGKSKQVSKKASSHAV